MIYIKEGIKRFINAGINAVSTLVRQFDAPLRSYRFELRLKKPTKKKNNPENIR